MAKKPTISTLLGGYASASRLNTIFQGILTALDNTLSRDGSTPNNMEADLDLNNNDLLNVRTLSTDSLEVSGVSLVSAAAVPSWQGEWTTSTSYSANDVVRFEGSAYICLVSHTSATFSTDLGNNYWELLVQKGAAGTGTGDMLGANNLSDVSNVATARSNLGLGSVALLNNIVFSNLAAAAVVTESEGIISNNNDITLPTSAAVKSYVDSVNGWELFETAYDSSVDGALATVTANGWADGYDYAISVNDLTFSSIGALEIAFEFSDSSTTGWVEVMSTSSDTGAKFAFYTELFFPRISRNVFGVRYISNRSPSGGTYTNSAASVSGSGNYVGITRATKEKMSGVLFRGSSGNINGGTVKIYRRKNQLQ